MWRFLHFKCSFFVHIKKFLFHHRLFDNPDHSLLSHFFVFMKFAGLLSHVECIYVMAYQMDYTVLVMLELLCTIHCNLISTASYSGYSGHLFQNIVTWIFSYLVYNVEFCIFGL
jgi:hypothetical protein